MTHIHENERDRTHGFTRVLVKSGDIGNASEILRGSYAENEIDLDGPPRARTPAVMQHDAARSWSVNIGKTSFVAAVRVAVRPLPAHYYVCFSGSGMATLTSQGRSIIMAGSRGVIIPPGEPFLVESSESDARVGVAVRIRRDHLEQTLGGLLGRPVVDPVKFHSEIDMSTAKGGLLQRNVRLIFDEVDRADGMARDPLLATKLSELLITSLLTAHEHSYSNELRRPAQVSTPRVVRMAMDFIHEDPSRVIVAADIAAAAATSVRAIERGFREHLGVSPMAYLRAVRLDGVHQDLLRAEASDATVAAIAGRWGFTHLSRFSEYYRYRFGVLPSQTLRERV